MQIGIFAPTGNPFATPEYLSALGRHAEKRGFHSLWVGEHVVLFDEYRSRYPYAMDGRIPLGGETGMLEPFTSLAFLASCTERIRLGTGICLLPQRNPVYTAKEVATLDWLSNGRVDFGVGIGWLREEFEALNVPWERRAARTREYLEILRRLWCDAVSEYKGEFYQLPACRQYPKPVQTPHPPIHFGGETDAALRRVTELGNGWHGFNLEPEEAAERIGRLKTLLAEQGRSLADIELTLCPYLKPVDLDRAKRYRDAGVDQLVVLALARGPAELESTLDNLAETLVEPARAL